MQGRSNENCETRLWIFNSAGGNPASLSSLTALPPLPPHSQPAYSGLIFPWVRERRTVYRMGILYRPFANEPPASCWLFIYTIVDTCITHWFHPFLFLIFLCVCVCVIFSLSCVHPWACAFFLFSNLLSCFFHLCILILMTTLFCFKVPDFFLFVFLSTFHIFFLSSSSYKFLMEYPVEVRAPREVHLVISYEKVLFFFVSFLLPSFSLVVFRTRTK